MKKRFVWAGIFILVFVLVCVIAWTFAGSALTSKEFPLSEKWAVKLQGDIQQISVVDNSIVIVRTVSTIYTLDLHSGNILWQQNTVHHFPYQPVLSADGSLFLTDGKSAMALRQSDGETLWQQHLRHPSGAEIVAVTEDLVAVNDPPYLALYQAVSGALIWEKSVCREPVQAYFLDTNIIVPCYGLKVMDALSGETVWETKSEPGVDRIWKSAFAEGVLYSSQDLKNVKAYDVKNRKQLWNTPLANDRSQAFKVVEDNLFVTKDNKMFILHRDNGRIIWCAQGLIKAKNPVLFGNVLYLFNGLQNGITAYDFQNGRQIGRLDFPAYNFITLENNQQLMHSSDEFLIFANGEKIYAYEK
jgi:outer membrane protein assembly factor BamB